MKRPNHLAKLVIITAMAASGSALAEQPDASGAETALAAGHYAAAAVQFRQLYRSTGDAQFLLRSAEAFVLVDTPAARTEAIAVLEEYLEHEPNV